jgi:hypothetical protein
MKTLAFSFVLFFCSLLTTAQTQSASVGLHNPAPVSPIFRLADHSQFASAENLTYMRGGESNSSGKCNRFKKMKTAGIVLSAVGGGLLVTGVALVAVGSADVANNASGNGAVDNSFRDAGMIGGGAACIGFGILSAGAGIPLAVIGSIKSKKYCGAAKESYIISTKGNSLALSF